MFKIDTSSAVSEKPAKKSPEGVSGYFADNSGGISTKVTADFLNSLMDELCNVINSAGISLDKNDDSQLLKALSALYTAPTGIQQTYHGTTAPAGWILLNGGTIGRTGSTANNRANDDTLNLYTLLWNSYSNTICPVSGGRGLSASADFAASKTLTLPPVNGRVIGSAGSGSGVTTRTHGSLVGSETHTLSEAEMPIHSHPGVTSENGDHYHQMGHEGMYNLYGGGIPIGPRNWNYDAVNGIWYTVYQYANTSVAGNHNHAVYTESRGSGYAHNNMQPTFFTNQIIKL